MNQKTDLANRRFAVFDIDGTLYRWQFFHELVHELASTGVLTANILETIDNQFHAWRNGDISFDDYEMTVVTIFQDFLTHIPIDAYDKACRTVVERSQHKLYYYPRQLVKKLQAEGYALIALSGSQQEMVEIFGKKYGFDLAIGALYERRGNQFTGKVLRSIYGRKGDIVRGLIEEYKLDTSSSVAIGDSDGDAGLLEVVTNPIAFNPASGLLERAKQEGWSIVIERKNMAYRLEKRGADIILAETIIY